MEEKFPITSQGFPSGKLLDGTECQILLDMGATKSYMSKSYYLQCKALHAIHLDKRLEYLHKLLQDFQMKRLALINKDRDDFQYNSGDLVYIISPLTSQLWMASRKVSIKYVGPLAA